MLGSICNGVLPNIAVATVCLLLARFVNMRRKGHRRFHSHTTKRAFWSEIDVKYNDAEFKRAFRMSRLSLKKLADKLDLFDRGAESKRFHAAEVG